jgi:excisionase family DNA binding protein
MRDQLDKDLDPKRLLITVEEAARRLSIGRSHIYAQMQRGRLRSVTIGRSRRILERDLDDFIASLLEGRDALPIGAQLLPPPRPVKGIHSRVGRR